MADPISGERDEVLVARSRKGDRDAFGELVRRWQRPLFARALASTRQLPDADDLVQETFLRAWQSLARFREDARFGAWVLRILANLAADRGRGRGREVDVEAIAETRDPRPDPEERILTAELADHVNAALAAIPPGRRKEVFRLRFVEGRTIQEIAQEFGVHTGTVKVHLFRLGRDLRRRLGGRRVSE